MKIPPQVKLGLKEGLGAPYFSLLQNWGKWSRCKLCQGYHTGHTAEPYTLTDEAGLWVDRAVSMLKKSRPQVWRMFNLHYVGGLDSLDIETIQKRPKRGARGIERGQHSYGVNVATLGVKSAISEAEIRGLIQLGERIVFDNLNEMRMQHD